jgi:hypothetical protein
MPLFCIVFFKKINHPGVRKTISILLVLITISISTNVAVAYHYCSGRIANVNLMVLGGGSGCEMEKKDDCTEHATDIIFAAKCCSDQIKQLETDDFLSFKKEVSFNPDFTPATCQVNYTSHGIFSKILKTSNFYRPPPAVTSVFLPLVQNFLI